MWLHYLTTALRASLADRFFFVVNLLGLAIGLASVAFIFLYVTNEFSHDSWLPRHQNLYRIDTVETSPAQTPLNIAHAPGPVKQALLKDFPEIEDISRAYLTPATVVRGAQPFNEDIMVADTNFFSLLGLPFAAGSPGQALRDTGSIAISERAAKKYFGTSSATGERITLRLPEPRDFVVSGVFRTIPANSHMNFDIVIPFDSYFGSSSDEAVRAIPEAWGGAYFHTYARLRDGATVADIERRLPAFIDRNLPASIAELIKSAPHEFYQFRFVPVRQVHFDGAEIGAMKPPSSRTTVLVVSTVAVLILLIASINFANLTMARSTLRAREVALRKVVGAKRWQIFVQFLTEAIFVTLCAGLIALAIVELTLPYAGSLLGMPQAFLPPSQWQLWAALVALVLVTALASAFYPSLVVSRIRPAAALNREYARRTGGAVRSVLVVLQFAISIGLIAATIIMLMQTRFTRMIELGFDEQNMLIVRAPEGPQREAVVRSFSEAVARNADVVAVTVSSSVPSDLSEDNVSLRLPQSVKPVVLGYHKVDSNFFRTYRVRSLAGRTSAMRQAEPSAQDQERSASAVVNEEALKILGFAESARAIGEQVRSGSTVYTIVGVVPNLHFRSLHAPVRGEMYMLDDAPGGAISIRYRTRDLPGLVSFVDRLWNRRVPDEAIDRIFLDEALDALYEKERRQARLLSLFSGVAIALSCLGLVAMAAFSVQRRTKEIAVRKVLGARTRDIARLLLWEFSRPVLLANLIAWPLAWLVMRDWLNQFAYRIDVPALAFVAAGLAALLIALVTVAGHALKVARTSPVVALRHE